MMNPLQRSSSHRWSRLVLCSQIHAEAWFSSDRKAAYAARNWNRLLESLAGMAIRLKGVQIENSLMCYQRGSGNSTGMKCLTRIMRSNLLNVDTVFITSLHYLPI